MTITITGGKYANNTIAAGTTATITSGSASIAATNTLTAGSFVTFSSTVGTSGGQVVVGTIYYVIATGLSGSAFQVSTTLNGTPITFNASGSTTFILATSVIATTANFVSTDFTVQRMVGMWNSGGTTLLGQAYVRAFVSTSNLQLETPFYDPATGNYIAQTAGNVIIVSKNFSDSVTTNLAVSNGIATIGDVIVFGSSSSATGVCFYDQDITLSINFTTTSGTTYVPLSLLGGLVVFGKLENYANNVLSQPVNINYGSGLNTAGQGSLYGFVSNASNSNFIYYGGVIAGFGITIPMYHGAYNGTAGYTMVINGVTCPFDLISPGAGGTWGTNASRMQLINCYTETSSGNAIGRRWGDGQQIGGTFKFPFNTNQPISALGANTGNFSFSAPPGQRATVLDFGANNTPGASSTGGPVLTRGGPNSYWSFTNLIATAYWAGTGQTATGYTVTADTGSTNTLYFQDTFSNLSSGTVGNINTTGLTSSASVYSTGSTTSWSPSLLYSVTTGFTVTTSPPAAWYYGLKCYGKQVVSGTITASTYQLIGATAPNVSFQQIVNQIADSGVGSITQAVANAYTSISTLDQLYAASSNWASLSAANATYPTISTYPITYSGSILNLGNLNLVLSTSGSAFSINTSTNTLTINSTTLAAGTIFTSFTTTGTVTLGTSTINVPYTCSTGTQGELILNNIISGSSIYVATSGGSQLAYVASSGTTYTLFIPPNTGSNYVWKVTKFGQLPVTGTFNPQAVVTATVVQSTDTFITQATVATVAAYTTLNSPDQIYDYAAYFETTTTGISFTRLTTANGKVLSFGSSTVTFNTAASSVYVISGTTVTIKTATTFINGITFSSGFSTSGTFTNTGSTTTINCLYVTSVGSSLAISLTVPIGSAVAIVSGSTVVQYTSSSANTTGIVTYYAAPGQTGSWFYRVAQYQFLSSSFTFTPSGQITNTINLSQDTGITQTNVATVAAYTVLTTCDQLYDYAAYWQTTNGTGGIFVPNLITKNGQQISFAGMALTFNNSTGTPLTVTVTSGAMTAITVQTGGTFATGVTFNNFKTTSTTTLTSTTITCVYTNSTGTSTVISVGNLPYTSANGGSYLSLVTNTGSQAQYIGPVTSGSQVVYIAPGAALSYSLTIACYGYISASYPFTTQGYVSVTASLATDTGITQTTRATVAAYTTLVNCDQFYDYAAYWQTTNNTGGITVTNLVVKNGTQVSVGAIALTFNNSTGTPLTATVTSGSVTALTIQTGGTFATGVSFTSFKTTTTTTLTSTTITCVYQNSSGISTVVTVSNLPYTSANSGSYLSLINNSGAQAQYLGPVTTGSQVIYIAPGAALSYSVKITCYGYIASTNAFTTQGYVSIVASLAGDTGITQATRATVAAYTVFTSPDQIYDYLAYFETTNGTGGITVTRPATKNGNIVAFDTNNIVANATASSVYTYTAGSPNTLTLKISTLIAGTSFSQFSTSGTVTLSNGSVINLQYSYATGTQVPIVISNLIIGSNYGVVNSTNGTVITSGTAATSTVTYYYQWTVNVSVYIRVRYYGTTKYLPFEAVGTITNSGLSVNANQVADSIGN